MIKYIFSSCRGIDSNTPMCTVQLCHTVTVFLKQWKVPVCLEILRHSDTSSTYNHWPVGWVVVDSGSSCILFSIHFMYETTLVYTPGNFSSAHLTPYDTMPPSTNLSSCVKIKGPPESPCNTENGYYSELVLDERNCVVEQWTLTSRLLKFNELAPEFSPY